MGLHDGGCQTEVEGVNVCLIPARSGSKRLPGKNTKDFYGKPVVGYSVGTAIDSGLFRSVLVSTDDENLPPLYPCELRPFGLSGDDATDWDVIADYIDWHLDIDFLCYLYPVAPMVTVQDLIQGYSMVRGPFNVACAKGQFYWIDVEWFRGATEQEYYDSFTYIPGIEYPDVNTAEDWERLRVMYAARESVRISE